MDVFTYQAAPAQPAVLRPLNRAPKTYYAKRLLEHGPLFFDEFRAITGWPGRSAEGALRCLKNAGIADMVDGQWQLI